MADELSALPRRFHREIPGIHFLDEAIDGSQRDRLFFRDAALHHIRELVLGNSLEVVALVLELSWRVVGRDVRTVWAPQ